MVAERRDVGCRRDAEARLEHAAEHDAEPERPGGRRHPHRLPHAARLRELDVDPVRALGARRHVGERVAVLVDVDRNRRRRTELGATGIARRERLLAVLDAELRELRQRVARLLERPVLVHVHLQRDVRDAAHCADTLDVEAVAPAELELQPPEPPGNSLRTPSHVVRIAEPDRPARERARGRQAEEPIERHARLLRAEVVERRVDGRARGVLSLRQPRVDLVEGPRVVSEQRPGLLEPRRRRFDRLAVAVDRRGFAVADETVVADLHLDELDRVLRLAGDDERLRELERDRSRRQLHARRSYAGSVRDDGERNAAGGDPDQGVARPLAAKAADRRRRSRSPSSPGRSSSSCRASPTTAMSGAW